MQARPQTLAELETVIRTEMQKIADAYHPRRVFPSGEAFIACFNQLPNWPASFASRELLIDDTMMWIYSVYERRLDTRARYWWEIAKAAAYKKERTTLANALQVELPNVVTTDGLVRGYLKYSSADFIRLVYSSGSSPLKLIYDHHLPNLRKRIFQGFDLPYTAVESTRKTADILEAFTKHTQFEKLEKAAMLVQRSVRAKARRKEERERLQKLYLSTPERVEKVLQRADTIYVPQCESEELSLRLIETAKSIKCFKTVSHYTSGKHLVSILDEGILGRRSLLKGRFEFENASLGKADIMNGDVDTVCFGSHYVDPRSTSKGLQITFDAEKLMSRNRSVFVKQKDFLMPLDRIRSVDLKDKKLNFTYTTIDEAIDHKYAAWLIDKEQNICSMFFLLGKMKSFGTGARETRLPNGKIKGVGVCDNVYLMTNNSEHLHAILIMNFFRFLDQLHHEYWPHYMDEVRDNIYKDIEDLSDDELKKFLTDVGAAMTDSMEFNIPGCHLVDFDSVISFAILKPHKKKSNPQYEPEREFTLTLSELILQLNNGDLTLLNEANKCLPNLFKSDRFLSYLLKHVHHVDSIAALNAMKAQTPALSWHKQLAKAVEEVDKPSAQQIERYRFF